MLKSLTFITYYQGRSLLHTVLKVRLLSLLPLSDYIDEVFGDKSLWPAAPHQKALARILVTEYGDKVSESPINLSCRHLIIKIYMLQDELDHTIKVLAK